MATKPSPKPKDLSAPSEDPSSTDEAQSIAPTPTEEQDADLAALAGAIGPIVPQAQPQDLSGVVGAPVQEQKPIKPDNAVNPEDLILVNPISQEQDFDLAILASNLEGIRPENFDVSRSALENNGTLRLMASFGSDTKSQAEIIQRGVGANARVWYDSDNVYVQENGSNTAVIVDPSNNETWRERILDVADMAGGASEFAVNVAMDAGFLAIAGTGVGAPAALTGIAGSAAASSAMRDYVAKQFGANTASEEVLGRAAQSAGLALILPAFTRTFSLVKNSVTKFKTKFATDALKENYELVSEMGKFANDMGYTKSLKEVGEDLGKTTFTPKPGAPEGLIQRISDQTGEVIKANESKLMTLSQGKKYKIDEAVKSLRGILEDASPGSNPIRFDRVTGNAYLRNPVRTSVPTEVAAPTGAVAKGAEQSKELLQEAPIFGRLDNIRDVQKLLDEYNTLNEINRRGGLNVQQLAEWTRSFGEKAKYDEQSSLRGGILAAYERINGVFASQRDKAVSDIISKNPGRGFESIKNMYEEASVKIPMIKALEREMSKASTSEGFALGLIRPRDGASVKRIKFLFGENSEVFQKLRSAWVADMFEKSIVKDTGVVQPDKVFDIFSKYGQEVTDELLTKAEKNQIMFFAKKARRNVAPVENLTKESSQDTSFVLRMILGKTLGNPLQYASAKASAIQFLFKRLGDKPEVLDFYAEEGMKEIAKKAASNSEKLMMLEIGTELKKLSAVARVSRSAGRVGFQNLANEAIGENSTYELFFKDRIAPKQGSGPSIPANPKTFQ